MEQIRTLYRIPEKSNVRDLETTFRFLEEIYKLVRWRIWHWKGAKIHLCSFICTKAANL